MFTLKFINQYDDGSSSTTSISAPHYQVYQNKNGTCEISLYKDFTSSDGVCYFLSSCDVGRPYFQSCYVENPSGKTINCIVPYNTEGFAER